MGLEIFFWSQLDLKKFISASTRNRQSISTLHAW